MLDVCNSEMSFLDQQQDHDKEREPKSIREFLNREQIN